MKKALNLVITYFILLLTGLLSGTVIYSFYLNLLDFIAGNKVELFSIGELFKSAIFVSYCLVFLIIPVICYYRVRHPGGISQIIAYVLICLFNWFIFFPGVYYCNQFYNNHDFQQKSSSYLSEGYFRPGEEKVYFFTEEFKEVKGRPEATGVIIDTSENGSVSIGSVVDDYKFELKQNAYPFKEIQVKKSFEMKGKPLHVDFQTLINAGKKSFSNGIFPYLAFLSIAVLFGILFGLSNFFEWRLINSTLIFFFTTIILAVNSIYYSTGFSSIKTRLTDNAFFESLGNYINEPLIFVINNVSALILILTGVTTLIIRKHKNKNR